MTFHIFWMFLAGAPALQTLRVWPFWDLPSCCFGNSSNHWLADLFRFADFCCSLLFKRWSTPLQTGWDWHCFSHDRFAVFWLFPVAFAFPYWQTPDCGNVLNWTSQISRLLLSLFWVWVKYICETLTLPVLSAVCLWTAIISKPLWIRCQDINMPSGVTILGFCLYSNSYCMITEDKSKNMFTVTGLPTDRFTLSALLFHRST